MKQIHIKPPPIIRFSMVLHYHHCPSSIWSILSHLRLALSPNTTKQMYEVANSIPLEIRQQWIDHETIATIGNYYNYCIYN